VNLSSTIAELNTSLDFSSALKLNEVVFGVGILSAVWMTLALKTITPAHRDFHDITIHVSEYLPSIANPTSLRETLGELFYESFYGQWMDLDQLLVQFWESRGIRPKVGCIVPKKGKVAMFEHTECLLPEILPEITKRGIVELVDLSVRSTQCYG